MSHIMLDIETLGTRTGSLITSIGAVRFNNAVIIAQFYERIDPRSGLDLGLTMDVDTVMWWMQQGEEARMELTKPGQPITEVLARFSEWAQAGSPNGAQDVRMWGNGASFDNAQLSAAYALAGQEQPWKFWNDRCYRTVKAMYPIVKVDRDGTHHHALDDAKSQARHLMKIAESRSEAGLFL